MDFEDRISSIKSKDELADFVSALREDLTTNGDRWENPTLERFLEAMEAWLRVMDQARKNTGKLPITSPAWQTFSEILAAASMYE